MHFGGTQIFSGYTVGQRQTARKNSQERKEPSRETYGEESAAGPWKLQIFMEFNQRFE